MSVRGLPAVVLHLARSLGGGDPVAELAVALACQATQAGHVCADLDQEAGWGPWATELDAVARADFLARLPGCACIGGAGATEWTPLVLDGHSLYLRRYWHYEQQVARDLLARTAHATPLAAALEARLLESLADAGQRQAARIALTRRLCLISGGPGTGKTHTLARIIGLLQAGQTRIALAAPTGKAAARMTEALQLAGVAVENGARTLHRLLGVRGDGSGFWHDRARPLAVDALVVDEASMIDLGLMARLLDALPATARLILLGDRDQLAAVEAGAVFADLCASAHLADNVAMLTTSFRFDAASGIGRLAAAVRTGAADAAGAVLRSGGGDLEWQPAVAARALIAAARQGYAPYLADVAAGLPPTALFESFRRFRVLCAHRQDADTVNHALSAAAGRAPAAGLPVMVVRNDALLRLYNGDIGIVLPDPADGVLKACFPGDAAGAPRWLAIARLPEWEPAWAMTVHKSQGSEFDGVLLALPAEPSPVVTRELVYTGVTRAKQRVALWSSEAVLRQATESCTARMSGLRGKLAAGWAP